MQSKYTLVLAAAIVALCGFTGPKPRKTLAPAAPPVTVVDDGPTYTLSNGYLTVKVNKRTGDLTSVKTPKTVTPNVELMGYVSGHHAGYWEQSPALAPREVASITIDPAKVNGDRGEVSVKGYSDGQSILGRNPTAAGQGGGLIADLEIRYTLERGAHGLYTYAIFTHQDTYPAGSVGESRFGFKLSASVFDWLSVDEQRNALMPTGKDWDEGTDLNMKESRRLTTGIYKGRAEHKYDYSADQSKIPAFGWSSTKEKVGLYIINPSFEYLSSGPLHFELTGHLDDGDGGDPTLLDYWRGTHYGGSELNFAANEPWTKVVGPIFIYVPTGNDPKTLFTDAKQKAKTEQTRWPYSFVQGVDYPLANQRATVKGKMKLIDPQLAMPKFSNLLVGLSYPDGPPVPSRPRLTADNLVPITTGVVVQTPPKRDYTNYVRDTVGRTIRIPRPVDPVNNAVRIDEPAPAPRDTSVKLLPNGKRANRGTYLPPRQQGARPAFNFPRQQLTWQNDAKHYEFWTNANADGSFTLANVRPGTYQLHAIADGVLGAYDATASVTITPGQKLDLGTIEWRPVHYGQQIFQVGTPNRSAKEFYKGDDHWHWGMYIEYAKYFPNDVNFTVGKSNPAKDWYIYHVPHDIDNKPDGRDQGRATPWTINFTMPAGAPTSGKATLRFGISGSSARQLDIAVNGKDVGPFTDIGGGGASMIRDGIEGTWVERDFTFDAALLKPGQNQIVLTIPAGGVANGICYDVIRLEVQ
ncbi:polysaccharide lyase family protein [Mucilaginibacter boryungensis]|uniref:rhamnogalacturonan endolyase n=1 Tax=Mucilaginibacter boryungensis TaxID=768480 RepID=A0ABR9XK65_9SPHI|nr:polysaccharide lyase family protein [Mucilaginibacter boryungensis]MBE9667778.1 lyase [Mucilaginibacter boryungensis]